MGRVLIISIFAIACFAGEANAQKENVWKTLAKVDFKDSEDLGGFALPVPVYSDEVMALNGKEIEVRGYLLPEQGYKTHREFVLSSLPYNLCYFCGKAGPETVMEVSCEDPVRYSQEPITLKGTLMVNTFDPSKLMYILKNARLVKE